MLSQKVPKGEKYWNPLGPKQQSSLELYDNLREKAGFDAWDVIYHSKNNGTYEPSGCEAHLAKGLHSQGLLVVSANQPSPVRVQSHKSTHVNVRIPHVTLAPPLNANNEEHEDWNTSFDEFQEWLGLACMGSQR